MKIKDVFIDEETVEKILDKHGVDGREIRQVLQSNPLVLKSRLSRYMAIGHDQRYLTVVFEYQQGLARVVTAYPASEAQIKLYRRKRKK